MDPIQFDKFTLSNGLDVILHEDHALPLVAVNIWYHVGSKDEEPGKTGFAHLFEHLMFEGSKNHNRSHFDSLQEVGATLNGSTNVDATNYWENLPSHYLELALWLEADRMGFLLDALDQRRMDVQRDVVKNERRQSYENRPYGISTIRLQAAVYPSPHPYHWPTIGFHEDLDAATLDDVSAFFQRYYTPSNASLAIAGDFDRDPTRALVEQYFGDLSPGPSLPRAQRMDPPLSGHVDLTLYDRVQLSRLSLAWPTVPRFHPDDAALTLLAGILGDGKSSRLHRALVHERRVAQGVSAFHGPAEITGDLEIDVTAARDHAQQDIEPLVRAEIERLRSQPPAPEEIARVKNRLEWRNTRMMANIGGFGGRANRLNLYNVYAGDAGLVNRDVQRYLAVEPEDVQRVAERYLTDRHVKLVVLPEPERRLGVSGIDRAVKPAPTAPRAFEPPIPERRRLANGLDLLVLERRGLPVVAFSLMVGSGAAGDPVRLPGLAAFTTAMLQEGTETRSSSRIADEFEFLGGQLSSLTGREHASLGTETLSRHWPTALDLIADLALRPTFPEDDLSRVRDQRLTALSRLQDDATGLADRVTPILIYGRESAYGHPAFGTEAAVSAVSREDLAGRFREAFRPEEATMVVVGDVSAEEAARLVESHFGAWGGGAPAAAPSPDPDGSGSGPTETTLFLLDKPGAVQSVIRVGRVAVPRHHPDYFPIVVLNHIFGSQFTSRLNMNLREDKGYSYGYRSSIDWHRGTSLLIAGGAVQTAVTRESVVETLREFEEIRDARPVSQEEFEAAKAGLLRQFPSLFETPSQVLDQLTRIVSFDLPDDYYRTFIASVEAVSLADVQRVAHDLLTTEDLTLVVVGDLAVVETGLRELGLPVRLVDHDGNGLPSP